MTRLALTLTASFLVTFSLLAGGEALPERAVKAAYLYNFALFTEWPDSAQRATFDVCVVGLDSADLAVESIENKKLKDRTIIVRGVSKVEETGNCDLLYVSAMAKRSSALQLLRESGSHPILTVTDSAEIPFSEVMIAMHHDNQHLGFDINTSTMKHAKLSFSSKMLRLARKVM